MGGGFEIPHHMPGTIIYCRPIFIIDQLTRDKKKRNNKEKRITKKKRERDARREVFFKKNY